MQFPVISGRPPAEVRTAAHRMELGCAGRFIKRTVVLAANRRRATAHVTLDPLASLAVIHLVLPCRSYAPGLRVPQFRETARTSTTQDFHLVWSNIVPLGQTEFSLTLPVLPPPGHTSSVAAAIGGTSPA